MMPTDAIAQIAGFVQCWVCMVQQSFEKSQGLKRSFIISRFPVLWEVPATAGGVGFKESVGLGKSPISTLPCMDTNLNLLLKAVVERMIFVYKILATLTDATWDMRASCLPQPAPFEAP
jgi:hypothetical protein